MKQKPVFDSWVAELDYYALTLREMKASEFPEDEDIYIRVSRTYLINEIICALKFLECKGLYQEYSNTRSRT